MSSWRWKHGTSALHRHYTFLRQMPSTNKIIIETTNTEMSLNGRPKFTKLNKITVTHQLTWLQSKHRYWQMIKKIHINLILQKQRSHNQEVICIKQNPKMEREECPTRNKHWHNQRNDLRHFQIIWSTTYPGCRSNSYWLSALFCFARSYQV